MGNGRSQAAQLAAMLRPVCEAAGLDLEHVEVAPAGRRQIVRVVVDRDGGVDLDAIAEISRTVSAALDAADALGAVPYVLEVTSPGVDRPLLTPVHWRRATGRLVRVELVGGGSLEGRVVACDEVGADLQVDGGTGAARVAYPDVARARVQVEFSRVGTVADDLDGKEGH
jgi:ribosome maturation factor RimP